MIPEPIQEAITKVGGTIQSYMPVCEGSCHYIVIFAAPEEVAKVDGAASFARRADGSYRADFILKGE
jgi:hypothetical protein